MILAPVLGLAAGFIHVLTGPDHLGAIAPLAVSKRQGAWAIGVRWGLGHSLGVVALGLVAALLGKRLSLDPEIAGGALSDGSERAVGLMLLAIAAWGFWRLRRQDDGAETRAHAHLPDGSHPPEASGPGATRPYAPYAIGLLHGCAGGTHLLAILVVLAFPTLAGVLAYLGAFVVGSVTAMALFAGGMGWLAAKRGASPAHLRRLVTASLVVTSGIGCWWLFG
jgi:hypothetical protein